MKKFLFINYIQGKDIILLSYRHSFNGVQRHFQQYFTYIVAASFIGMGLGINYVILANHLDWVAQTSIKFKCQLNLKCKFILCTFQVNLRVN